MRRARLHRHGPDASIGIKKIKQLLGFGDVKLVAGTQANDIAVSAPLSWANGHGLTLDARHSIRIDHTIDVAGPGALTLTTNDGLSGGTLSFGRSGNVHFWSTSNSLTINDDAFTLVDSIAALASAVATAPSGNYALSGAYDATPDGVYAAPPVATNFTGAFDGLGNTISHLRVNTTGPRAGLFAWIDLGGAVENLVLKDVAVKGGNNCEVGAVAGLSFGRIENVATRGIVSGGHTCDIGGIVGFSSNGSSILSSSSAGTVRGTHAAFAGGLAGTITGGAINTVANSHSTAAVTVTDDSHAGGLIGIFAGLVTKSWAGGAVTVRNQVQGGPLASAGGLIGYFLAFGSDTSTLSNCYASGPVHAGAGAAAGGLIGVHFVTSTVSSVVASYSFGTVSAGAGGYAGGLIGYRYQNVTTLNTYWDMTQSGINDGSKGVGNHANDAGITGLSTTQLQSGLPQGFSAAVWAENPHYLNGLPFLIANLPD
ncbi:MAG: hypothetical protein JOZ72_16660 [Alphaproteobacteria bacterium]|nr:hypothetical protein [Alphaproteobacteria bacterium]